jgi:hypothetical protein
MISPNFVTTLDETIYPVFQEVRIPVKIDKA